MACYYLAQEELDKEENKLLESSDNELESSQRSPIRKCHHDLREQYRPSKRSRFNNSATALETKIIKSEE